MNEREIFTGAIAIDSATERAAYLDKACGGDRALRDRIEQLLKDEQSLGSFLESSPPGVAPTSRMAPTCRLPWVLESLRPSGPRTNGLCSHVGGSAPKAS